MEKGSFYLSTWESDEHQRRLKVVSGAIRLVQSSQTKSWLRHDSRLRRMKRRWENSDKLSSFLIKLKLTIYICSSVCTSEIMYIPKTLLYYKLAFSFWGELYPLLQAQLRMCSEETEERRWNGGVISEWLWKKENF